MKKKGIMVVLLILIITIAIIVISCSKAEYNDKGISNIFETEIMIADLNTPKTEDILISTGSEDVANTVQITETMNAAQTKSSEQVTDYMTSENNSDNEITEPGDLTNSEGTIMTEQHDRRQYDKVIMVGDSRFRGMSAVSNNSACIWICEDGMGYTWLQDTAVNLINENLEANSAIVFNLGVNDPDNKDDYVEFINSRVEEWVKSGVDLYFMTVNPVDNTKYFGYVTNNIIEDFNNTLMSNLSPWFAYIDTYNYLLDNGFESSDGLHYENSTYQTILEYCLRQLRVG